MRRLLLLPLLLPGCVPESPAVAVLPPAPLSAAVPEAGLPVSLSLSRCLALAEAQSERLGAAAQEVRLAEARRALARSAILPRISARASHLRQEDDFSPGTGASASFDRRSETRLALEQPLFQGFQDLHAGRGAALLAESALLGRGDVLRELRLTVSEAYAGVLASEGGREVVSSALAVARDRLEELRARLDLGLARRADVLSAEAQAARQEALQVQAEGECADARAFLSFLIGQEVPAGLPLESFPDADPPPGTEGLLARALARRGDLAALDRKVQAAREAVLAERAARWPGLDLTGNLYGKREGANRDVGWDLTVTGTLPLFDGGEISARVSQALAEERKAELATRELRREIARELEEAGTAHRTARALVESLRKEEAAAAETAALLLEEAREGIAPHSERLRAEDDLLAARVALARQSLAERVASMRLRAAAGDLP